MLPLALKRSTGSAVAYQPAQIAKRTIEKMRDQEHTHHREVKRTKRTAKVLSPKSSWVGAMVVLASGGLLALTGCSGQTAPAQPADTAQAVILIPGLGGSQQPLATIKTALKQAGYRVVSADIGDGQGDLAGYAADISGQIAAYGNVSVVGYSAGGLIARALEQSKTGNLIRVVTIASPHQGSNLARLGSLFGGGNCSTACRQLSPGSEFLESLEKAPGNNTWLSLWTENDEAVTPPSNSELDGALNIRVQDCGYGPLSHSTIVTHQGIANDVVTFLKGQEPDC